MINLRTLILAAGVDTTVTAQDSGTWGGFSIGATAGINYADSRAFTNRSTAWGGEATLDVLRGRPVINARVFVGTIRTVGKERLDLGTTFSLQGWRAGMDLLFDTPVKPLKAYAGLSFNYWTGDASTPTTAITGTNPPTTSFQDGAAKFGWRLGVEYRLNRSLAISADYNQSEWRHDNSINTRPVKGLNPVNPNWVGLTVRYYPQ